MTDRFGVYARASLFLAVFLGPVVLNRNALDPFGLQKLAALWTFGLLALAMHVVQATESRRRMPRPQLAIAAGAFVGAFGVATVFSQAPLVSLFGIQGRYGGIIPLLLFVTTMVTVIALYWDRPERVGEIAWAVVLGALVLACYIIIQQAGLDPISWTDARTRQRVPYPFGTMGNSNFAGAYLAISLPLAVYLVTTAAARHRPWLLLVLGLLGLALWYTQSRGAFLAAVTGLMTMSWLCRDRLPRWIKVLGVTGAAAMLVAALAVLWHPWSDQRPAPLGGSKLFETTTAESRGNYWVAAWRVFLDHPVHGTGPDTFYATYPSHRVAATGADPRESLTDKPHNVFMEYAANTGTLGLGAYLVLVGSALWFGIRQCRRLAGEPRLLLAAVVAMLMAYLAQAAVSIDVPGLVATGWVAMGAIAVLADPRVLARRNQAVTSADGYAAPPPVTARRVWGGHIPVALALVGLLALGMRGFRADINAGLGHFARASELNSVQAAYRTGESLEALAVAKAATEPGEKLRYLEVARDRFEKTLEIQPGYTLVMLFLAETHSVWAESIDPGHYRDAIAWWDKAAGTDPANLILREVFADAKRKMEANVAQLEAAATATPQDPNGWLQLAKGRWGLGEDHLARVALDRVLSLDPANREARTLLDKVSPR